MEMKQYLIDTFNYNSHANKKVLESIKQLPDKESCIKFFSHLINCQYKWMARLNNNPAEPEMSWWKPYYPLNELEAEWDKSLAHWITYLNNITEAQLATEVSYRGYDGGQWGAKPQDIALQLNYHSIHHRGQMQLIIRKQGLEPEFVDYIGTVCRKLS